MRTALIIGMLAAGVLLCGRDAHAAQCTISTTSVLFGTYDVLTPAPLDSLGTIVFNCNGGGKNVAIMIDGGQAGTFGVRKLFMGAEWLGYNLFRDASRTTVWGDGSAGTSYYTNPNPPNGRDVTVTIYARVPAEQDVRAGDYNDSLVVTINF